MVDAYWRKIESIENDIENSMQISSNLLKLKGYDKKSDDLSKIDTNKNNISSNLERIDTNKNNIASNLEQIDTNKDNISSNLNQIDDIKSIFPKLELFKKHVVLKTNHLNLIVM